LTWGRSRKRRLRLFRKKVTGRKWKEKCHKNRKSIEIVRVNKLKRKSKQLPSPTQNLSQKLPPQSRRKLENHALKQISKSTTQSATMTRRPAKRLSTLTTTVTRPPVSCNASTKCRARMDVVRVIGQPFLRRRVISRASLVLVIRSAQAKVRF